MSTGQGGLSRFFDIEEDVVDDRTSFHSPKVKHLYDWWRAASGRSLPSRDQFDIVDHKLIVGNVFLVEVRDGAFAFRLLGEEVNDIIGRNRAGERVKPDGAREYGHALDAYYRTIAETRTCRRCVGSLSITDKGFRRFESIDCPLSSDGATVDMIIGVLDLIR